MCVAGSLEMSASQVESVQYQRSVFQLSRWAAPLSGIAEVCYPPAVMRA